MLTVGHLLEEKSDKIFTTKGDDTLQDVLETLASEKISSLPVVDDNGLLVGIISERDYIRKAVPDRKAPWDIHVRDYMTENVFTVTQKDSLRECMKIMSEKKFRHLPVMENNELIGILSITDIVRALSRSRVAQD